MTDPPRRLDLLDAARAVQRAAIDGDVDALHEQVCRLRNALVAHVAHGGWDDVGALDRRVERQGQQRLIRFIDELLTTTDEGAESCTCLVRGAELRSLLIRQLRLESTSRRRPPTAPSPPSAGEIEGSAPGDVPMVSAPAPDEGPAWLAR